MSEPKTVARHNQEFTGHYTAVGNSPITIASGMVMQIAWEREKAQKDKIRAVLKRYLQDEILIQQMVAELYKAETA